MSYEFIRLESEGRVAKVILNRPDYRNAQSRRLLEELDQAFAELSDNDDVGVIVLTGEGDHFSAGHDLGTPDEQADLKARPMEEGVRGRFNRSRQIYVDYTLRWRDLPKPTIAVVKGYCIFGGWMIASAMDMIFAAEDAMFLAANFQYFSVPWDMHPRKAKEMLFESRFIDGREALDLELVNRIYPADRLMEEAMAYATNVAANDPFQLRMIKMAVNQMQDTQGFAGHITAAHTMHILSSTAEMDPGFALQKPDGRRRPMVQRALENYEKHHREQ
ncbi:MAG: enoyl-CoA hydratase/isomerase family protein [Pseudomonadales bacterium]|nr:enoyl-CoA hydratase/isomerase family protein [Pseudomonadales bacterium]